MATLSQGQRFEDQPHRPSRESGTTLLERLAWELILIKLPVWNLLEPHPGNGAKIELAEETGETCSQREKDATAICWTL